MKADIRWQLILAVVCLALLLTLFALRTRPEEAQADIVRDSVTQTTPGAADVACASETPLNQGGFIAEGLVGAPQYLNPLLSDHNVVDQEITDLVFDGLLRYDNNGRLTPALATVWTVSEDGRTVTFDLRENVFWHDGEPFTAADVAFTYGLLQDEAFPGATPDKVLWQAVEINVINDLQIAFTLPTPYAPFLAATTRGIVPQHRLADATAETITQHPFNKRPVGSGPFVVSNDWQESGQLLLQANPYMAQKLNIDGLVYRFYSNEEALLEAFAAGDIQAMHRLSPSTMPQATTMAGIQLYTASIPRYVQLLFNLSDSGAAALKELEVRQALAYATDRENLVDDVLDGQGLIFEGPYLPSSFAYDRHIPTPIAYNPISATVQLDNAGWLLAEDAPNALRTHAAVEEGAEPQTLNLMLLTLDDEESVALGEALQKQWRTFGVGVQLDVVDAAAMAAKLQNREFDLALVEINPAADPDLYDFWSQEAIIRGQNYGSWNNRRASEALEAARQVWNQDERLAYYRAFLTFYADDLPALTLFQPLYSYAVNSQIENVDIGVINHARDRYQTLSLWAIPHSQVADCADER